MIAGGFIQKTVSEHQYIGLILLTRDREHTTFRYQKLLDASHTPIKIITELTERTAEEASSITAVINLAGSPISSGGLVNTSKFKDIHDSRICFNEKLISDLKEKNVRPEVFISASAMAINSDHKTPFTEDEAENTAGNKVAELCQEWEKTALKAQDELGARVVTMRLGNVVDVTGGMLLRILPFLQKGYIPSFGDGEQIIPWITLYDVTRVISHLIKHKNVSGPVHVCTSNHTGQMNMFKELAAITENTTFRLLRLPVFLVKFSQKEAAYSLITSVPALPSKLEKSGFRFRYNSISEYVKTVKQLMSSVNQAPKK